MTELVWKQDVVDAIEEVTWYHQNKDKDMVEGISSDKEQPWYKSQDIYEAIKLVLPVRTEIIRCIDCKWWDRYSDKYGYCNAAKHGHWSKHWEIQIRRTYEEDFFCADAERRGDAE